MERGFSNVYSPAPAPRAQVLHGLDPDLPGGIAVALEPVVSAPPMPAVLSPLDHAVQRMRQGERVILSDRDCDAIANMDGDWVNRFATLQNPQRCGVQDAWLGFIKPSQAEKVAMVEHLETLIAAARAEMGPDTARPLVAAWERAEVAFGVTPQQPDGLNMAFDNRDLDLVYAAYNLVPTPE